MSRAREALPFWELPASQVQGAGAHGAEHHDVIRLNLSGSGQASALTFLPTLIRLKELLDMHTTLLRLVCAFILTLAARDATAVTVTFQLIPGARSADDMSPDGRYIVGVNPNLEPYLLDTFTNQMTMLPPQGLSAVAVSDDGSVVLGDIIDPGTNAEVAAIWTSSSGVWTSLGYLPNALSCPSRSNGYELSADGSVAVGLSWDGCSGRGFRWTQATGMIELEPLANGGNRASVCSADGNVIGGFAQGSFSRTPTWWTGDADGFLLDPPNGDAQGEVYGLNDGGTILLGEWNGQAVKWTGEALDRSVIGAGSILPGWTGIPQDIATDETIVGFDILFGNRRAWIQPSGTGSLIDLKTYVVGNGGTVPTGTTLEVAQAISLDGRKIIGHGFASGAWLITIVPDCAADVAPTNGNGAVNIDDLLAVINNWGAPAPNPADVTGNGVVDIDDLLAVINAWGSCPGVVGACCTGTGCSQVTESDCSAAKGTYLGNSVPCSPTACDNNDFCADAIDITANINGATVQGDNSTATPPFGGGDGELPAGSPSCQWFQNPGAAHSTVWYSFVAPANGGVTIATCGSSLPFSDSTIGLYSGSCGALVEFACDEDGCEDPPAAPWYSRIVADELTPGATYYICVMNPGDWSGSVPGPFGLTITSP
jgi:hypothetical protein